MEYLLAHDVGTSGDKAVIYTSDGRLVAEAFSGYATDYPQAKWAEQDPETWWAAFCKANRELLDQSGVNPADILALSFSAQMNSCLPLDTEGKPLRRAMIWADQRAGSEADELANALGLKAVYERTGQRLSASHGIAKMMWFARHEPGLFQKTAAFVQPKDYLSFRLTGVIASDYSDASHLGCFDLNQMVWSEEILRAAGIGRDRMPELQPSYAVTGSVNLGAALACGLKSGTPVVMGGGDGPCATAGAGISHSGQAYAVLGSSGWIATLSDTPYYDPGMRTFNLMYLDGRRFMPLGSVQMAGLALNWALDTLFAGEELDALYPRLDDLLEGIPAGSLGLLFLPYLLGERSPWWNSDASGCFIGLTPRHDREAMLKAVLEGVGLNMKIILDCLNAGVGVHEMRVIGGGARSVAWLRILADVWQQPLYIPQMLQYATGMGAAICAGIGAGVYKDFDHAAQINPIRSLIQPDIANRPVYTAALERFLSVYKALEPIVFS